MLSIPVGRTGMIFAGLGCPHGCDFCCTSHFFKRRHIKLLPTGDDVFRVIERYLETNPRMSFTILDEDFLIARERANRLRELVQARGTPLSIFAFATVKALSKITPRELLETGIDGVWMGYEGTRSGFGKQQGRPVDELIEDLRGNGITVLTSMILGFDYQTPEVVRDELRGLLALRPALAQFLIYGPTPGTPFFERVVREGRLHQELRDDPAQFYKKCDGFTAMVSHPTLLPAEIEALQQECFATDYATLGPSVVRAVEVWFAGWKRHHASDSAYLRRKAESWAKEVRQAWPLLRAARRFGPTADAVRRLEAEIRAALGPPGWRARCLALVTPLAVAWTKFTLRHDRFQHPKEKRRDYRRAKWALRSGQLRQLQIEIEHAMQGMIVSLRGALDSATVRRLAAGIKAHLASTQGRLEIVMAQGTRISARHLRSLTRRLRQFNPRVSIVWQ